MRRAPSSAVAHLVLVRRMRIALAFFWLCATAAVGASEHRSREFNHVTATFAVLNPSVLSSEPLKIAFSLRNASNRPVVFRYLGLDHHIEMFSSRGERAHARLNAPMDEIGANSVSLKPGEIVRRVQKVDFSTWYDLAPGDYYLIFEYDLRLLPDSVMKTYQKKLHSNDRVAWDTKKYWFHVHR